jgi:perosamine synthetase
MDYHIPLKIQMSAPDLTDLERDSVLNVISTSRLSMGPQIEAFESAFRSHTGCKHALGVSSGTAGLHLCVHAAGIKTGDYVITTPFSFVASSNVLLYENAIPVYVDVDPKTGNINPALVEEAAADLMTGGAAAKRWLPRKGASKKGNLKAILSVDVFGQPADYDPLAAVAGQYGLRLINDSCESLGAVYKNRKAGTLGDYGVFAFYPNKQVTTGEGGMIVTDDDQAANLMASLRNQGRAVGDTWLQHTLLGYNYRLDEMSAALGTVQMNRLEEILNRRKMVAGWYNERLSEIVGIEPPKLSATTTTVSWFVYVIRLTAGIERTIVAERLAQWGIPVRPYFLPIHLQPYIIKRFGYKPGDFPIAEDLGQRGLALPFSARTTEKEVDYVCQALGKSLY